MELLATCYLNTAHGWVNFPLCNDHLGTLSLYLFFPQLWPLDCRLVDLAHVCDHEF